MNDKPSPPPSLDSQRSLLLMNELESGEPTSQREIASRLGIAVGLVNSYLKTLVHKGLIQVKAYPRNRYGYLLTPKGFAEKSRLAYEQLSYFHKLFMVARRDSAELFERLRQREVEKVYFCGVDEFTEIAYLSLREAGIVLAAIMDENRAGEMFIDVPIISVEEGIFMPKAPIIMTSLRASERYFSELIAKGLDRSLLYGPIFDAKDGFNHSLLDD